MYLFYNDHTRKSIQRGGNTLFLQTGQWIALPEALHIALLFLSGVLAIIAMIALLAGIAKKRKTRYFILWGAVLLLAAAYLAASLGFGWIVADTMTGGCR